MFSGIFHYFYRPGILEMEAWILASRPPSGSIGEGFSFTGGNKNGKYAQIITNPKKCTNNANNYAYV